MSEIDTLTFGVLQYLIIAGIVATGGLIATLWRCVHKLSKDMFRLKKGFILFMRLEAKKTKELHPEANSSSDIEEIIKEMMKDDEGRL